jgi:hypothetical protein
MRNAILLIIAASLIIGGIAFYGAKTFAEATTRAQENSINQIDQLAHPQLTAEK